METSGAVGVEAIVSQNTTGPRRKMFGDERGWRKRPAARMATARNRAAGGRPEGRRLPPVLAASGASAAATP